VEVISALFLFSYNWIPVSAAEIQMGKTQCLFMFISCVTRKESSMRGFNWRLNVQDLTSFRHVLKIKNSLILIDGFTETQWSEYIRDKEAPGPKL
jgi:putative SOS response-associated peptidase YedK